MPDNLKRVALITGASRGIGAQSAKLLAAQGKHVVLVARHENTLKAIEKDIQRAGGSASLQTCDLSDGNAVAKLVENVAEQFGRLDILVNNAGATRDNLMIRLSDEDFDQIININLRSAFIACRAALRPMMRGKFGRVINIASVAGVVGNAGQTNYAAAKSGLIGMTKSIAKEMASKKITANVVAPGFIETAMTNDLPLQVKKFAVAATPLARFGQPEEVAAAIAFLASDQAGFITGQTLAVDGGMTMC